jgi:hypothetical protein
MAKEEKIRCFKDLYAYLEKHKERYFLKRTPAGDGKPTIEVSLIDENGNPVTVTKENPTKHEQLAKYVFMGVEVSRPELTIPQLTIKALVQTLSLDPNIFKYPPSPYM